MHVCICMVEYVCISVFTIRTKKIELVVIVYDVTLWLDFWKMSLTRKEQTLLTLIWWYLFILKFFKQSKSDYNNAFCFSKKKKKKCFLLSCHVKHKASTFFFLLFWCFDLAMQFLFNWRIKFSREVKSD